MPIGVQIITRKVEGGQVVSRDGTYGSNPNFPALNVAHAYEIVEKTYQGQYPAFRLGRDGSLQIVQIEPINAEYVEPIKRRL